MKNIFICLSTPIWLMFNAAIAQPSVPEYPSRPIVSILAAAPGSSSDKEARLYFAKMSELMGQQFVMDSKPGAGGTVGSGFVAKSKPDGYTLLMVTGTFSAFGALYKDLPFDTLRDFAPISLMSQRTSVFLVTPSFPANTFAEYIAYAASNPGKINFATPGAGSVTHLAGGWIHSATKTSVTFVHYKGAGALTTDLVSGRVVAAPLGLLSVLPLVKAGKLRVLAIMNKQRSTLLPGVPTIAEKDIPGYDYSAWLGFSAPAGTPAAIINKLSENFAKVAKAPDVTATMEAEGSIMVGSTPLQFRQYIAGEIERWQRVVQQADIRLEE